MSYDVKVENGDDFNYNYNMSDLFDAYDCAINTWDGLYAFDVEDMIYRAMYHMAEEDLYHLKELYDAPNGWGTAGGAFFWLFKVGVSCHEASMKEPRSRVWVS